MTIDRLLQTKLHIPFWPPGGVSRPRLLARLQAGLAQRQKLTLISAPAGYGKTTLMAEWLAQEDLPGRAWLSLDAEDDDPATFLAYWLAAFERVEGAPGQGARDLLEAAALPPISELLDELLNDLATYRGQIILVLDDLHVLANPQIHEAIGRFVEYQPAQVHLAITTREDPPLPLARMRARGQLTEIRAHDLRFTPEEARQFFNGAMRLDLDPQTIDTLERRTEGWAAGLHLAALAVQRLPDRRRFLEDFGGSHRYVIDYLAEEVVRQQDEETRSFLTRTAVLRRFNASLCNALTGREDSQRLLEALESANLFVIPLDGERKWYRYHQLFADYLRVGLDPGERAALCRRASAWHEANGMIFEGVRYAFAASRATGDLGFAAAAVGRAMQRGAAWSGGRMTTLIGWLEALPPAAFQDDPLASLNASRILYLSGRFDRAEALIDQAEEALGRESPSSDGRARLLALAAVYRGGMASIRGDVRRAVERSHYAQSHLPAGDRLAHARAAYSLGLAYELSGKTGQAIDAYRSSSDLARAAGVLFLAVNARCAAASAQIVRAELSAAEAACREAMAWAAEPPIPPLGLAQSILGRIALERDDLAAAEERLREGIALSRKGGLQDDASQGLIVLAHLQYAQGDLEAAMETLEQGTEIVDAYGLPRITSLSAAHRARFQLAAGRTAAAVQWAAAYRRARSTGVEYLREFEDLTLARVLLATGEGAEAAEIVAPLLDRARAAGRGRVCIEALLVQALCRQSAGNLPAALACLAEALQLAAPEGMARLFVDEGEPILSLLPQARAAAPAFAARLLAGRSSPGPDLPSLTAHLPEPLTDQEERVLGFLGQGMTNREIAGELVISLGTAKWHVHNVLQKLGVDNRAQAVVRAHELGIV